MATVTHIWATAFLQAAQEQGLNQAVFEDIQGLLALFKEAPEILDALGNPKLSRRQAQEVIRQQFSNKVQPLTIHLLLLLLDRRRWEVMEDILAEIVEIHERRTDGKDVFITTAKPIKENERKSLEATLYPAFDDFADFEFKVDPKIIGGLVVEWEGQRADGSIRRQLENMKKRICQGPVVASWTT
jgi:F-type H+-transporting ATPase subunit delta